MHAEQLVRIESPIKMKESASKLSYSLAKGVGILAEVVD